MGLHSTISRIGNSINDTISGVGSSINDEYRRTDDNLRAGWNDNGQSILAYTGAAALIAAGFFTGGATTQAGVQLAMERYKYDEGKSEQRKDDKNRKNEFGSLMRAQARARDLQPKGIDPEQAVQRRRQRMAGALGRSDTILTGPLGLIGGSGTGGRVIGA